MGLIVDTNVFILFERRNEAVDLSLWAPSEDIYISAVTACELLIGVHRADTKTRRDRRSAFVEAILAVVPTLDFTAEIARVHAEIYADLAKTGQLIGAHDLIIAATARYHGHSLLTENADEFARVPGLQVMKFSH